MIRCRNPHFNHIELLECPHSIKHTYEMGVAGAENLVQVYRSVYAQGRDRSLIAPYKVNLMFGTHITEQRNLTRLLSKIAQHIFLS
jgi:hypothetical protein